eukprot:8698519-Prorocentrum_lima.AAC.1
MRGHPDIWTIYDIDGCPSWAQNQLRSYQRGPLAGPHPAKGARAGCPKLAKHREARMLHPMPKTAPSQPVAGPIQLYAADPYWFPAPFHWEPRA